MDIKKRELATKASILYYENDQSQNQIAKELGISRSYVSQLLSYARDNDIITININIDEFDLRMLRQEVKFKKIFPGLKDIYIMRSESIKFTNRNIGKFAVPYIVSLIDNAKVIGVNLGKSVKLIIDNLKGHLVSSDIEAVVQLMGGLSNSLESGTQPNELVQRLGEILDSEIYYLNCPVWVEDATLRTSLFKEQNIKSTIDMWDQVDLAIMGIGIANEKSKLFSNFNVSTFEQVKNSEAYGELSGNFFNNEGEYLSLLRENMISISGEELNNINNKVVIGFGDEKQKSILAALKGGLIDVLVTDSLTVDSILENI